MHLITFNKETFRVTWSLTISSTIKTVILKLCTAKNTTKFWHNKPLYEGIFKFKNYTGTANTKY